MSANLQCPDCGHQTGDPLTSEVMRAELAAARDLGRRLDAVLAERDASRAVNAAINAANEQLHARIALLDAVATAARRRLEVWTRQTYDELRTALDALDGAKP